MHEILNYLSLECYSSARSLVLPSFSASFFSLYEIEKIKELTQIKNISINSNPGISTIDFLNENGEIIGRQKIM